MALFFGLNRTTKITTMTYKHTNKLIHESSPYLLQHAHNPVDWVAWNQESLLQAKNENKLILISIGYAACHWCHVMEHECFEDENVAQTMNSHFVNIKVDREERPDIDHIYMDALQMMTGSGGWPLNILALPDGKPFWGATFVKKEQWIQVLNQLQELYITNPEKVIGYAENMANGLKEINAIIPNTTEQQLKTPEITKIVAQWATYFDTFLGGYKRAPKFMMPVNINFLMHFGHCSQDTEINDYVKTTLTRMAWGGIFDHVGGGFSRYAVDTKWHVPHFEKMLYDNGLLISLYSKAYAITKNKLYKDVAQESISFLKEELLDAKNGFYSSLDADSLSPNGTLVEGAYYVWKEEQLKSILKEDYTLFSAYFNINSYGYWEEGNYVLIRDCEAKVIAKQHNITENTLQQKISDCLKLLKTERLKRNKPRLDDKILTSWNGLALKGLTDAYRYLGNKDYLKLALNNANFIEENLMCTNGGLFHNYKNGKSSISAFLEDYAAVIDAFIGLYEVSFAPKWLELSVQLTSYVLHNFTDPKTGLFFFTSNSEKGLIRRTLEVADNVIPSSNSIMAHNLLKLSKHYPEKKYELRLHQMMNSMHKTVTDNPQNHANWLHLFTLMSHNFYEVVVIGENYELKSKTILESYLPNVILAASKSDTNNIPLLKDRYVHGKTLIYTCEQGACQLPVTETNEALELINTKF